MTILEDMEREDRAMAEQASRMASVVTAVRRLIADLDEIGVTLAVERTATMVEVSIGVESKVEDRRPEIPKVDGRATIPAGTAAGGDGDDHDAAGPERGVRQRGCRGDPRTTGRGRSSPRAVTTVRGTERAGRRRRRSGQSAERGGGTRASRRHQRPLAQRGAADGGAYPERMDCRRVGDRPSDCQPGRNAGRGPHSPQRQPQQECLQDDVHAPVRAEQSRQGAAAAGEGRAAGRGGGR